MAMEKQNHFGRPAWRPAVAEAPVADALCLQLRSQLGPFGYQWLCACAVYPTLRFPLSTYLGAVLAAELNRPPPSEDEHFALFRLPWFQQGGLPEPLRVRLVGDLEPRVVTSVRAAIERALFSVEVQDTDPTVSGPVPLAEPPRRWRAMLRAYWDGASPDAAENDRIFIRYMSGRRVTPEAIARQRWLESWLGRDLLTLLRGGRALMLVGAAGFAVAAATADSWLRPTFERTVQVPGPETNETVATEEGTDLESNVPLDLPDGNVSNAAATMVAGYEASRRQVLERRRQAEAAARVRDLEVAARADAVRVRDLTLQRDRLATRVRETERALAAQRTAAGASRAPGSPSGSGAQPPAGQTPVQTPVQSPVQSPPPSRGGAYAEQTASVQDALKREGFYRGVSDGRMGRATVEAIRAYQRRRRLPETGTVTPELLRQLGIESEASDD